MNKRRRLWVLVGLLVGVSVVWGVAFAQNFMMERELAVIAKELELENEARMTEISQDRIEAISVVTAAMDHVVYGQPLGKIAVYMVQTNKTGERTYQGIEYHYLKQGATWTMTDSGACTANDALDAAMKAFGHTPQPKREDI